MSRSCFLLSLVPDFLSMLACRRVHRHEFLWVYIYPPVLLGPIGGDPPLCEPVIVRFFCECSLTQDDEVESLMHSVIFPPRKTITCIAHVNMGTSILQRDHPLC